MGEQMISALVDHRNSYLWEFRIVALKIWKEFTTFYTSVVPTGALLDFQTIAYFLSSNLTHWNL